MSFYSRISKANVDDLDGIVGEAYEWFDAQHADGQKDLVLSGRKVMDVAKRIPGLAEFRYGQFKEICAIISCLERHLDVARGVRRKHYTEHYARALTPTQVEKYIDGDLELMRLRQLIELMELSKGKFEALSKGIESLNWKIRDYVDLLKNQLDDAIL